MSSWCNIVCVINSWNLAVSQCYQSCSVGPISLDFEYPLIYSKSSVVRYPLLSVFLQTSLFIILLISFLIVVLQFSRSYSIGLCHASWIVLGSVGPDVTAEIKQVS